MLSGAGRRLRSESRWRVADVTAVTEAVTESHPSDQACNRCNRGNRLLEGRAGSLGRWGDELAPRWSLSE